MSQSKPARQLKHIALADLNRPEWARDIRTETVEEIKERIETSDYNPAKPLRVFESPSGYEVADGNHRVRALRELGKNGGYRVPCVVEPDDADRISVAVASNRDEDTHAEQDLFDHLDYIKELRDDHTQAEIAERLGWGESKVKDYSALLGKIVARVLGIAKQHQDGRATAEVASATFSEYWFRTSGLYDLNRDGVDEYALSEEDEPKHAQVRVMEWFVHGKNCDATKSAVQRKVEDVEETCEQLEMVESELNSGVDDAERAELRDEITAGTYTNDTLTSAIENANHSAKDRAEFGTGALEGLRSLDDNSVDCVVTDPPYGVEYESHRDTNRESFPDEEADTFALLDDVFAELGRVCKANAHVYVFFSMKRIESVREVAGEHFDVAPVPLIWAKHNHAPTRDAERGFEKMYAQKYEPILMCRLEKGDSRRLNGSVSPNLLQHSRPEGKERWHDAQKPRELLAELITNSTGKRETILDPFAGSGSTLLAAAENNRHYIGFEQSQEYADRFTREIREVTNDE
jgi:DNA modification methylase/anti-sigma28 factor (negative regulator of flagellin synthesis)